VEDIETILNTLVYDGKVERSIMAASASFSSNEQLNMYRAVDPVLPAARGSGIVRMPCGTCSLIENCYEDGPINPKSCVYMKQWLDF
jgi:DNA-directed RNA polymerase III subunit RPC6